MSAAPAPCAARPSARVRALACGRAAKTLAAAAAVGGAVLLQGSDRQPSDPTRPLVTNGAATRSDSPATFRIGTFNIHGGRGPDRSVVELDRTADVLRASELDFVGLNELHASPFSDQAAELGDRLGCASVFAATERRWWHDHFGNGLLTRRPLGSVRRVPLPGTQGKKFRNAVVARFDAGGTSVRVVVTHLDTVVDRDRQLAAVIELFRSLEAPAVLLGDFNTPLDHPRLRDLLADREVADVVTDRLGPAGMERRIDHIFVRGLTCTAAGVVETDASDHPHVWAELAVPTEPSFDVAHKP